jgi:hypothetical protein
MDWNIRNWFGRKASAPATRAVSDMAVSARSLAGGRATVDTEEDVYASALSILSPVSSDEEWRSHGLDSRTFDRMPVRRLVELLANVSPDVSKALWDFLRFCNPGHERTALRPGTETQDGNAQKALDGFISQLHGPYTVSNQVPFEVIISSMFIAVFLRGAVCSELVLNRAGNMPLELATPDPASIIAQRVDDPERGKVWQIGQRGKSEPFIPITRPTVCYIPVDPLPGRWEGRALAAPAVFSCLFLIGMLHDLRRVVAQQGYPRLDLEVDLEMLLKLMPRDKQGNPVATKEWVEGAMAQINAAYGQLQPDHAYVHLNHTKVNRPVGTLDTSSLGASKDLIGALERFTVRSLKTMPFLMGINESTTETLANRQWEAHAAGIKAIQHLVENTLERQLSLALRVQGIQADVRFRFAELRAAEEQRDAQTEALKIANAARKRDEGFITQDEAAMSVTGKKAATAPWENTTESTDTAGER